jgi:uncharacterized protein
MNNLIGIIAQELVDNPQEVSVSSIEGDQITVYELRVAKTDLGKVIGRKGRNALALRTIMNAVSSKAKKRAILEIVE